jgi:hypothetical protein
MSMPSTFSPKEGCWVSVVDMIQLYPLGYVSAEQE